MTQEAVNLHELVGIINDATKNVTEKLKSMKQNSDSISIGEMFEMQMLMNHLSQLSEMCTGVVSAMNTSIMAMARNVKG